MARSRAEMMADTRERLLRAGRKAFAEKGFAAASMDELTASVGLTRGALYHNFGDKKGLLAAVVAVVDAEMADRAARAAGAMEHASRWERMVAEGMAYIELALDPEIQRIVLRDGPAFLGDPSQWPSQNACLTSTRFLLEDLVAEGVVRETDPEAAARLINGAAMNAALWVAASDRPDEVLPKARQALALVLSGFLDR